jgi:tryptophanyl-tRNA synthetase
MRVVSGIQPTGAVHLGNYFGALVYWVKLQNEGHECFFFLANLHTITLPQDPVVLKKRIIELAATLFAVGIDPEKSTLFVQSDVPEHAELAWIFNCLAPLGEMERMIQFKEKSQTNPDAVNAGLFLYPVLQAADIMLYKANVVPVGVDQAQHLELTRDLARKFNRLYRDIFPEPRTLHTETTKVVGLDGTAKMSKSRNNYIALTDTPDEIWAKLKHAATDPARVKRADPGTPEICNIYALHKLISPPADQEWSANGCRTAAIGCMDCKGRLRDNMVTARRVAQEPLKEVYDAIGFSY